MSKVAECPECAARCEVPDDAMEGEIIQCDDCGAELEITALDPLALAVAPDEDEDWGE